MFSNFKYVLENLTQNIISWWKCQLPNQITFPLLFYTWNVLLFKQYLNLIAHSKETLSSTLLYKALFFMNIRFQNYLFWKPNYINSFKHVFVLQILLHVLFTEQNKSLYFLLSDIILKTRKQAAINRENSYCPMRRKKI